MELDDDSASGFIRARGFSARNHEPQFEAAGFGVAGIGTPLELGLALVSSGAGLWDHSGFLPTSVIQGDPPLYEENN